MVHGPQPCFGFDQIETPDISTIYFFIYFRLHSLQIIMLKISRSAEALKGNWQ